MTPLLEQLLPLFFTIKCCDLCPHASFWLRLLIELSLFGADLFKKSKVLTCFYNDDYNYMFGIFFGILELTF